MIFIEMRCYLIQILKFSEASLALMMIHREIETSTKDGQVLIHVLPSSILALNEAVQLGKWFSCLSIQEIENMINHLKQKIVILDRDTVGHDMDLSIYQRFGDVIFYDETQHGTLEEVIKEANIVVVNKVVLDQKRLEKASSLKLICLFATGYNNIDLDYCRLHGIEVRNVKGYSTTTVAQHTFALLFHLFEKISYYDDYVKSGKYIEDHMFTHFENHFHDLEGLTWGIVGLGQIGQRVSQIAQAFGCQMQYYSTSGHHHDEKIKEVDWETLLKTSDIISIHAPLNEKTYHLFNEEAFAQMKSDAYLLNLGRGPIIDESALTKALENNMIAGAGLDVLEIEPMSASNPLFQNKDSTKLLITPHIAWASVESRQRVVNEVYRNILSFLKGEERNKVC